MIALKPQARSQTRTEIKPQRTIRDNSIEKHLEKIIEIFDTSTVLYRNVVLDRRPNGDRDQSPLRY
jgi:hypothetical protein